MVRRKQPAAHTVGRRFDDFSARGGHSLPRSCATEATYPIRVSAPKFDAGVIPALVPAAWFGPWSSIKFDDRNIAAREHGDTLYFDQTESKSPTQDK
jgi:hypothetical protein